MPPRTLRRMTKIMSRARAHDLAANEKLENEAAKISQNYKMINIVCFFRHFQLPIQLKKANSCHRPLGPFVTKTGKNSVKKVPLSKIV